MAHRIPSSFAERSNLSGREVELAAQRLEIRKKLRKEFISKVMDPYVHGHGGYLFDPLMQRFVSSRVLLYQYFHPTPERGYRQIFFNLLPMFLLGCLLYQDRTKFEKNCRTGKIPYEKRLFKMI